MYYMNMRRTQFRNFMLGLMIFLAVPTLLVLVVCSFGVQQAGTPLSGEFTIQNNYRYISAEDGRSWRVIFQSPWNNTFSGTVRHVSRWEDASAPFMSHDVLVTSGAFTDPALVKTSVMDHRIIYRFRGDRPQGEISLLHVFPASAEVLAALEKIHNGDQVRISGREIFVINFYNARGNGAGHIFDRGCYTILVTKVEIIP
ncbi:MAG: hypothetical protein JEZ00_20245 [Anaerolineaceae bacterium]|nr:hypothetical protein [Anaerolineaceae bacterium]